MTYKCLGIIILRNNYPVPHDKQQSIKTYLTLMKQRCSLKTFLYHTKMLNNLAYDSVNTKNYNTNT